MSIPPRVSVIWASARVAAMATAVVAVLFLVVVAAIDFTVYRRLHDQIDQRLETRLAAFAASPRGPAAGRPNAGGATPSQGLTLPGDRPINVPLIVWIVDGSGDVVATTPNAPDLPVSLRHVDVPRTASVGGANFRLLGRTGSIQIHDELLPNGRVIVGQSLDILYENMRELLAVEAIAFPLVLVVVFAGAWLVGRWSAAPIEQARRRQLAFTADASHELRTPLAVIEAETSIALQQRERPVAYYRGSLERIADESVRLRHIVEDLLWLARYDATPAPPRSNAVDLSVLVPASVARFSTYAARRRIQLAGSHPAGPALVSAPPEWIDRLLGVLIDNACRYTPEGGRVEVSVEVSEGRVRLTVDDSGPGIPPDQRSRIFDRFHRATTVAGGAGLGLAIGDAVVRGTAGRWEVGDSPLGGARVSVTWPVARDRLDPGTELDPAPADPG